IHIWGRIRIEYERLSMFWLSTRSIRHGIITRSPKFGFPKMRRLYTTALCVCLLMASYGRVTRAESQSNGDYKGVTDPFGDPSNYEFSEDEKEDKEFFHLGRYVMLGADVGIGAFTGGLGRTANPGLYIGAHMMYFFDKSIAFEIAG